MKKHGFLAWLALTITAFIGDTSCAATAAAPAGHSDRNAIVAARHAAASMLSGHPDFADGADHILVLDSYATIPATPVRTEVSSRKVLSKTSPVESASNRAGTGGFHREAAPLGASTWRSIGAVAFVLGGLLAASAYLKKRQGFALGGGKQRSLRIIERLPLDTKRSIVLLEIEGRRLLVGAGTEHIETLADLGMEDEIKELHADLPVLGIAGKSFRSADGSVPGLRVVNGGTKEV